MNRLRSKFVWTSLFVAFAILPAASQRRIAEEKSPTIAPTCDAGSIDPDSYALTTGAQAAIVNEDRSGSWWERFSVDEAAADLYDLNSSATYAAERARKIDPRNLLSYGLLARQYVVTGEDAELAHAAWRTTLDNGGAVVWTATLYDVDARSFFVMAFNRESLRVYRYGALAGSYPTHLGVPQFVGADRERFWRAMGGCIDPAARAEAVIPWSNVHEIKSANWVIDFKLSAPVTITSDLGKKKHLNEIKVNLHGAIGTIETHVSRDPTDPWKADVRTIGMGPFDYQQRVRSTIVKFVDPAGRIKLPKGSRSAGW
jgi:hypothetical protein